MRNIVWVVDGRTESGDDYVFVFDYAITWEDVSEYLKVEMPEEWEYVGDWSFFITKERVISKR